MSPKRRPSVVIGLAVLLSALLAIAINVATSDISPRWLLYPWIAWPLVALLVIASFLLTLWQYRIGHNESPLTGERYGVSRTRVLQRVQWYWVEGVLNQSLYKFARLELAMTTKSSAIDNPWRLVLKRQGFADLQLPRGTRIEDVSDQMANSMLILGSPGAGKTTLLLELTKVLLQRATEDSSNSIPVVFSLSTWSLLRRPLAEWLVDELRERYDVPEEIARPWVDQDRVFILLDGLDEVSAENRERCVHAINDFRSRHGLAPMVICSRTIDYMMLASRLRLQGAIVIEPLARSEVIAFWEAAGDSVAGVREALERDNNLWELLDSPLMLNIAVLAYQGHLPTAIKEANVVEDRRTQLFDAYIEAMLNRRAKNPLYRGRKTIRWLSWLAGSLSSRELTILYVEWMQPDWLPSRRYRRLPTIGVAVSVGVMAALLSTLIPLAISLVRYGRMEGVLWVLVPSYVVVVGLAGGLFAYDGDIRPPVGLNWSWTALGAALLRRILTLGIVGSVVGLTLGLVAFLSDDPFRGSAYFWGTFSSRLASIVNSTGAGFAIGSVVGIVLGVPGGFSQRVVPPVDRSSRLAKRTMHGVASTALVKALIAGLISGVVIGIAAGLTPGVMRDWDDPGMRVSTFWFYFYALGCLAGFVTALAVWLLAGGRAYLQNLVLRALLVREGAVPWRYKRFLDYAVERVFLRRVGNGYIFVHRLLMEHLAVSRRTEPRRR
jgi:hypothetical protein